MPTKAELEKVISDQADKIRKLEDALDKFGKRELIRVILPWAMHGLTRAQAPYIKGADFHDPNRFQALVMEPLVDLLRRYGIDDPSDQSGTSVAGELSLVEGTDRGKTPILIHRDSAAVVAGLIDGISQFSRDCYAAGHHAGSDLLGRLVEGEITADQFDESRQQELARARQNEHHSHQARLERSIETFSTPRK